MDSRGTHSFWIGDRFHGLFNSTKPDGILFAPRA
ncbi:hypothetical protein SAMN04488564_12430 [Lentzea waywayandensis]|uniref:Uncharacterized protein n=1 Tax=Lentzea waywayandensis TaxID=84724 RepID=A0A1I6FJE9_9PSEU|nr:hypothetical protein SAMN04488564_12430 [Lentzea waywayandensis]